MAKRPQSLPHLAHNHHHRARQRAIPSPSTSILGLLATLASSVTVADGSPVSTPPPEFLCPHLATVPSPTQAPSIVPRTRIRRQAASPSTSAVQSIRSGPVADKYVSCADGKWRKTDVWTLYGSTVCGAATCSATPTATATSVANQSASATITSITDMDIINTEDVLPSGWEKSSKVQDDPLTPVIITLSVVLAIAICAFIVVCVMWRRKRARRLRDPEKRGRKMAMEDDDIQEDMQRVKSQQRLWARASARWKANVRQSARRRRKRPAGTSKDIDARSLVETASHASSISLHRYPTRSSVVNSIAESMSFQDRDSYNPSSSAPPETHHSPSRPPAYLPRPSSATPDPLLASQSANGHRDSPSTKTRPAYGPPLADHGVLPPADTLGAGHIATDDKAALARMAVLASAPPSTDNMGSLDEGGPSTLFASVPVLDEFEVIPPELWISDFGESTASGVPGGRWDASSLVLLSSQTPMHSREPSPLLPAPPSRGRLAAPTFYEYPLSFEEDVLTVEPEAGPSAPPFDDGLGHTASAPPLDYDPENSGVSASAPPMEENAEPVFETSDDVSEIITQEPSRSALSLEPTHNSPVLHVNPPRYIP